MESQKNLGWKGLLEVTWLLQLLKQKHFQVRTGCSGICTVKFCLCECLPQSDHSCSAGCLSIHLGLSLLQAVPEAADDSNHISLDLSIFPLGKPSSLNGSDLLFIIKMNFINRFQMDTLKDSTMN